MLIALTGGIGAGKSTVGRLLASRGAVVIDADVIARSVIDPRDASGRAVLAGLRTLFGDRAFLADGSLDRKEVAAIVFGNDAMRAAYGAILRPAILSTTAAAIAAALAQESGRPVVHEIPLLSAQNAPLPWTYDLVVTVEAPLAERLRRLTDDRGYELAEAQARVVAQGTEESRAKVADVVLHNDGSADQLRMRVTELWEGWTQE